MELPLLTKIAKILNDAGVPYMITGGFAVSVWGRARATFDIDVVIELLPIKKTPLYNALRSISGLVYISEEAMDEALRYQKEFNLIDPESDFKVDFFIKKSDPVSKKEFGRRIARKLGNSKVYFISPEDLILSKLRWYQKSQSNRHFEDAASILRRQKKLDPNYLKKQAAVQLTLELLESLLKADQQ